MSSFSSPTHLLLSPTSPSNSPGLPRASGSESDVSQASRGSGSLETSKGKPLVSQYSLNLCLEVADAIIDSLGLLVELAIAEEVGAESTGEGGVWELPCVEAKPDWSCHEAGVVLVGVVVTGAVVGSFL